MTREAARLSMALPLALLLASCDGQRVEYIPMSVIAGTQLQTSPHDPVPDALRSLANYYRNPTCNHKIVVPVVTIRRVDLSPVQVDSLRDPLSELNRWRRRHNYLPASHLMADYDERLQRLPMPFLVSAKATHGVSVATLRQMYPQADVLIIDDSLSSQIQNLRNRIQSRLCRDALPAFEIIFDRRGAG